MKSKLLLATLSTSMLFGCSTHSEFSKTGAGLMAWDNDLSAAIIVPGQDNRPNACMQMAMTMRDTSSKVNANVSDALLKVVNQVPTNATPQELINLSSELTKTSKTLRTSTERTSFLLVGAFYLCQFQANGMSETNIKALADNLITTAGSIGNNESNQEKTTSSNENDAEQ
ncbi:hypothetical protein ACSL9C_000747 [Vibrio navarrensis]